MRGLFVALSLFVSLFAAPVNAEVQTNTLSVTVSFRERIALPPGAQLDVKFLEVVKVGEQTDVMASQRFAMAAVPTTISLSYDPRVVDGGSDHAVFAVILSPDGQQLFRATETLDIPAGSDRTSVDIVLTMVTDTDMTAAVPRRISGVAWSVTEAFGAVWPNDDPATLMIDREMNVSAFGGCNRFLGQMQPSGRGLAFAETMAGTMKACPDEVEAQERRFLAALVQVSDYVRYGAGLVMTDAKGRAVLHFVETPE